MRFHVLSMPHTHTLYEYSSCAYTIKVINFCRMMKMRGHVVYLYSGEFNEAPCDEHISCISEAQRVEYFGVEATSKHIVANFDTNFIAWKVYNENAAIELEKRIEPGDFICAISGVCHQPVAEKFPEYPTVEFGIGYSGTFSPYRIYESYAWMHTSYGGTHPYRFDYALGEWMHAVIPGYLDPDIFPFEKEKDDYYLFIGRLIDDKGWGIAVDVCKDLGKKLVICGQGTPPPGCDYRGVVGPEERGRLMSKAKAVFVPSFYLEPFGNVNIEAQACGTPVITTDWGAFTETVIDGVTGFRCRTFGEFKRAAERAGELDPTLIRQRIVDTYSLDVIAKKYEDYFIRLGRYLKEGWYDGRTSVDEPNGSMR